MIELLLLPLILLNFVLPRKIIPFFSTLLIILFGVITSTFSLKYIIYGKIYSETLPFLLWQKSIEFSIDNLSAFFILIINFTTIISAIYSLFYNKKSLEEKTNIEISLHYSCFYLLHWSMVVLTMLKNTISFLYVWEIMSFSSFILVLFDSQKHHTRLHALNYLIQMHIGLIFLILGFTLAAISSGEWTFDGIKNYMINHNNLGLFLIFFIGFGFKAGFIPFHTWLPVAHPAAPSHISAVMSGVMIKMGIYGIMRIVFLLQNNFISIGLIVLIISIINAISGVSMAIVQHNLKKLLAYHSIENIGIIGIGIGFGILGIGLNNQLITLIGFTGGLLHVLNHSLFKSLLFLSSGSVYKQTNTINVDHLGGLLKKMPFTSIIFMISAIAICGLPPFNGFISEFLIYSTFINTILHENTIFKIISLFSIISLSAVGGMAIFCFTKAFSISFLGNPRQIKLDTVKEIPLFAIIAQMFSVIFIILIGIMPKFFVEPISKIISQTYKIQAIDQNYLKSLSSISILLGSFILSVIVSFIIKKIIIAKKGVKKTITWNCAYNGYAPKTQYTADSFAENFYFDMENTVGLHVQNEQINPYEYFPNNKKFETHNYSPFEKNFINPISNSLKKLFKKSAFVQTGKIQNYVIYPFITIIILIILTLLKII